ncbi:MAG: DinB family protein [Rubrivivax sp.]|nr:DinB family protein [Pyrinomonadaceae bacterium]
MSEIADIVDELKRIQEGDAWHGPSLGELLSDVTAEQALSKPIAAAHSVWEIVLHVIGWGNVFMLRLEGHPMGDPPEGDFPLIEDTSREAWAATIARLEHSHAGLVSTAVSLSDSALEETVVGKDYTKRFLLDGAIRHHVYHAGQIALLKKAFAAG